MQALRTPPPHIPEVAPDINHIGQLFGQGVVQVSLAGKISSTTHLSRFVLLGKKTITPAEWIRFPEQRRVHFRER